MTSYPCEPPSNRSVCLATGVSRESDRDGCYDYPKAT
jgi:hypothetical protein